MKNWMGSPQMLSGLVCVFGLSCGLDLSIERTAVPSTDMSMGRDPSVDAGVAPDLMPPLPAPTPIQVTIRNCTLTERPSINTDKQPFGRTIPTSLPITVNMDERCKKPIGIRAISAYDGYIDCELAQSTFNQAAKFSSFSLRIIESSRLHNFVDKDAMVSSRGEIYFTSPFNSVRHFVADDDVSTQPVLRTDDKDIKISLTDLKDNHIRFHFRFSCYANFTLDVAVDTSTEWQIKNLLLVPIQ